MSIKIIKFADGTCKEKIVQLIKDMYERPPTEWKGCIKVGLIMPLFKKGQRNNTNNYRGVPSNYGVQNIS